MSIYKEIKKALITTVDAVVDKTTTQAQKSRLVTVMKNEEKIANQVYIELGKYLYRNLRSEMTEEIEELCAKVDQSKERMSRAQEIYREVIQQELVNREINRTETKENLKNIKDPLVSMAKDTAVKVKDTAKDTAVKVSSLRDTAAEKAAGLKSKASKPVQETKNEEKIETIETIETIEMQPEHIEVIEHVAPEEDIAQTNEVLKVGQGLSEDSAVLDNAIFSDSSLGEDSVSETEEPHEIFSSTAPESSEAADVEKDFFAESEAIDQEFQRSMPVDIISENDFEADEPEVKPAEKNTPFTKAMKLRKIMTKKNTEE